MKKIYLLVLATAFAFSLSAQDGGANNNGESEVTPVHSHGMWLGGKVGFNSLADRGFDYTVAPHFGVMIGENIAVGGVLNFSGGNDMSMWNLAPYFRYYIHITDNFAFFGDAFAGFGKYDDDTTDQTDPASVTVFGARPGIQYWFNSKWSIAASTNAIEFNNSKVNGVSNNTNGFGLNFNDVNFSFFFHF